MLSGKELFAQSTWKERERERERRKKRKKVGHCIRFRFCSMLLVSNLLCDPFAPSACASHRLSLGNMNPSGLMDGKSVALHPPVSPMSSRGEKKGKSKEKTSTLLRELVTHYFSSGPLAPTFTSKFVSTFTRSVRCNCIDGCFIYTLAEHKIAAVLVGTRLHLCVYVFLNHPSLEPLKV